MAKVWENFRRGTLASALVTAGTTIDFGTDPGFATLSGGDTITLILDPLGLQQGPEIVYLTAYTATQTTGTISRAQEGTSDPGVSHPVGTVWAHNHTAADIGGGSSLATIDDPALWSGLLSETYEFDGVTTSLPSGWAWTNQGGASYDEKYGGGKIIAPTSSGAVNIRALTRAIPAASAWTAVAKFGRTTQIGNFNESGFVLRDSVSGELITWGWVSSATVLDQLALQRWNSPTSFNSQTSAASYQNLPSTQLWLRVTRNSATDWDFGLAIEHTGGFVDLVTAHDPSAFLTIDEIGFQVNPRVGGTSVVSCSWMRFT